MNTEIRKFYEELFSTLDLTESLMERYSEYEILAEVFPSIYADGDVPHPRIGWSGEEI